MSTRSRRAASKEVHPASRYRGRPERHEEDSMFPAAFDYRRADSADEAMALLQQYGGDARILAGGQSLIPAMRFRLARPAVLVDINPLADLDYIREQDGMLVLGALARDAALERTPWIGARYPLISDVS